MGDLDILRTTLGQLRDSVDRVGDAFARSGLQLAAEVLSQEAGTPGDSSMNASRANAIRFAFADVEAAAADLSGSDAALVQPLVERMRRPVENLAAAHALSGETLKAVASLQAKLKIRSKAIQRRTFEENPHDPLPHPPEQLAGEARLLRDQLAAAGFSTPSLDVLVEDPSSVHLHGLTEIVDELDVIAGT